MKNFILMIFFCLLGGNICAENLITDDSFETAGKSSWSTNGPNASVATNNYDYTAAPYHGNQCLRMSLGSSGAWNGRYVYQEVNIEAGQPLEVKVYAKIPNPIANCQVYLEVAFKSNNGSEKEKGSSVKYINQALPSWTLLEWNTNQIPINRPKVEIRLVILPQVGGVTGQVYWDKVYAGAPKGMDILSLTNSRVINLNSTNRFIIHGTVNNSTNCYLKILKNGAEVKRYELQNYPVGTGRYMATNWNGFSTNGNFYGDGRYDLEWRMVMTNFNDLDVLLTNTSLLIDSTAPYINFSVPLPLNDSTVYSRYLNLKGASDAAVMNLYVNNIFNRTIPVNNNSFSYSYSLQKGWNDLKLEVIDSMSNIAYKLIHIKYSDLIPADNTAAIKIYCSNEPDSCLTIPAGAVDRSIKISFSKIDNSLFDSVKILGNGYGLDKQKLLKLYRIELLDETGEKDLVQFRKDVKIVFNGQSYQNKISSKLFFHNGNQWILADINYNRSTKQFLYNKPVLYHYFAVFQDINIKENKIIEASPNPFTPRGEDYNTTFFITAFSPDVTVEKIEIFNNSGLKVRDISPDQMSWDGYDNTHKLCPGGVYKYMIRTDQGNYYGSIVLIR